MPIPAVLRTIAPVALCLALLPLASAQSTPQVSRISPQANLSTTVRMTGQIPAWANSARDAGAASPDTQVRLTFMLSRTPDLQASFEQLLSDQQNPNSPRYHQWLTPGQIGEQFGATPDDITTISRWLTASGLKIVSVSPARTSIAAEGPVSTISSALSTTFHLYTFDGQPRLSANAAPAIPAAFASVISNIRGISELPVHPLHKMKIVPAPAPAADGSPKPLFTSSSGNHYLFPGDFAKIYDINTLTTGGYDGTGVKVAVLAQSQIVNTDVTLLQGLAGLPAKAPNPILVPGSVNPGLVTGDRDESTLDVNRVLNTAPGVQADLVIAANNNTSDGVVGSLFYNIDTLLDPVETFSYGSCENSASQGDVSTLDSLFSQAAAEGISTFISSGDAAAAACSDNFSTPTGTEVVAMGNEFCSSSYVTCVGGTEFAEAGLAANYWSATNDSTTRASALGYIPEGAWNEPTTTNAQGATVFQIAGSGGGASQFIAKPSWQVGTGVPADGHRDIPDVSFSSADHDGYLACLAYAGADCSKASFSFAVFSGTSAAAPSMAAITAILIQRLQLKRQGNINPLIYKLAASNPTAFHDANPATSGVTTCTTATASMCNNSVASPTSITGGLAGSPITVGYDLVTGLGSVDVTNFVNAAVTANFVSTSTTLTASPATINTGSTATLTATVTAPDSSIPTGTVNFFSGSTMLGTATLTSGKATTSALSFNTAGTFALTAVYSGTTNYASSTSAALNFAVTTATPAVGLTLTAAPTTATLSSAAANTITSTVTIATTASFTGTVSLACAVTPATSVPPTCSISPSPVTFTSATTGTSTLTLNTKTPTSSAHISNVAQTGQSNTFERLSLAVICLALIPVARRRRFRLASSSLLNMLPVTLLLGAALLTLSGCGGGGGSTTTPPTPVLTGTTKGTYTVTVTATPSTGTAATSTVTLTVN